jgi:serine/threonine protein kinase
VCLNVQKLMLALSVNVLVTYVAPEVVLNKGEDPATREGYNTKADIWSLGVILYILYGRGPRSASWASMARLRLHGAATHTHTHTHARARFLSLCVDRLSGRPPFYDDTPQGVLMRIRAADYDFPATEWDYVSNEGNSTSPLTLSMCVCLTHRQTERERR